MSVVMFILVFMAVTFIAFSLIYYWLKKKDFVAKNYLDKKRIDKQKFYKILKQYSYLIVGISFAIIFLRINRPFLALFVAIITFVLPKIFNIFSNKSKKIEEDFIELIGVIKRSLIAGKTVEDSLRDAINYFGQKEIAKFLLNILKKSEILGEPVYKVMDEEGKKLRNESFIFLANILKMYWIYGGNVIETLQILEQLIRRKAYLQKKTKAVTAEGKFTAIILASLSPLIGLVIYFINPNYMKFYFSKEGFIGLILCVAFYLTGIIILLFLFKRRTR